MENQLVSYGSTRKIINYFILIRKIMTTVVSQERTLISIVQQIVGYESPIKKLVVIIFREQDHKRKATIGPQKSRKKTRKLIKKPLLVGTEELTFSSFYPEKFSQE